MNINFFLHVHYVRIVIIYLGPYTRILSNSIHAVKHKSELTYRNKNIYFSINKYSEKNVKEEGKIYLLCTRT